MGTDMPIGEYLPVATAQWAQRSMGDYAP